MFVSLYILWKPINTSNGNPSHLRPKVSEQLWLFNCQLSIVIELSIVQFPIINIYCQLSFDVIANRQLPIANSSQLPTAVIYQMSIANCHCICVSKLQDPRFTLACQLLPITNRCDLLIATANIHITCNGATVGKIP